MEPELVGAFLGALGLWRTAFGRLMAITAYEVMGRFSVCMPWVTKEILLNKSSVGGPFLLFLIRSCFQILPPF